MLSVFQLILTLWQTAAQASGSAAACLNRRRRAEPGRRLLARQWEAVSADAFLQFKATAPQSGSETASPPEPRRPPPPVLLLQLPASVIIWVNQRQCKRRKKKKEASLTKVTTHRHNPASPSPTRPPIGKRCTDACAICRSLVSPPLRVLGPTVAGTASQASVFGSYPRCERAAGERRGGGEEKTRRRQQERKKICLRDQSAPSSSAPINHL